MPRRPSDEEARSARQFFPSRITLPSLVKAAASCRGCDLYRDATQTVFGNGAPDATFVLVGEQPGNDEDLKGFPFVGPAGRILDRGLEAAGIDINEVYLTNAVKHFKWAGKGAKRIHKKPTVKEVRACLPWLEQELEIIKPDILICLGATAAQALLRPDFKVTVDRGRMLPSAYARLAMATVHPSAVVRQTTDTARRREMDQFIADLKVAANARREAAASIK